MIKDEYIKDAHVGIEVNEFLSKTVGKELWLKADDDVKAAFAEFLKLDPTNTKGIYETQLKAHAAYNFKKWICEFLDSAKYAKEQLANAEVEEPEY